MLSCIDNTLKPFFFELRKDPGRSARRELIDHWAMYVIGQYLSWTWILRRKVQFLKFDTDDKTEKLARILMSIQKAFSSSSQDPHNIPIMLWHVQQIAIGEIMSVVDESSKELVCMGFAEFSRRMASEEVEFAGFKQWFTPFKKGSRSWELQGVGKNYRPIEDYTD